MFGLLKKTKISISVTVFIKKEADVYYAFSPTLPGLHVEGETETEVKKHVEEAVLGYILSLIKHQEPLPVATVTQSLPRAKTYTFTQNIPSYA